MDPLRIAGVMYLHDYTEHPALPMLALAELCTDMYFITHDVEDWGILDAIESTPKLRCVQPITSKRRRGCRCKRKPKGWVRKWSRAGSLEICMRLMDGVKPDVVLLPDDDEILPPTFPVHLEQWRKIWDVRPTMSFRQFQCIGDPDTILAENVCRVNPHCKAIHWAPGLEYNKYAGWCWSSAMYRQKKYHCPHPMRHLAYMSKAQRLKRAGPAYPNTSKGQWRWFVKERKTMAYDPQMTWVDWEKVVGPYRTEMEDNAITQ